MDGTELGTLLEHLVSLGRETEWIEFKENNSRPDDIGQYISALSNSACLVGQPHGFLVFGVTDIDHIIVGTDFDPRKEKRGNEELESWLHGRLDPNIDFSIIVFSYSKKRIVLFQIDACRTIPIKFQGKAWVRVGTYKHPLHRYPEKERKIWSGNTPASFESHFAAIDLSDDEALSCLDYPMYYKLIQKGMILDKALILSDFEKERFIVRDGNKYNITNLGALLFAAELQAFPSLARKAVRLIFYKGVDRLYTEREVPGLRGYASGFAGLIKYIVDSLPQNEVLNNALRAEIKMYPEIAIRELVANALIHQDLTQPGTNPMIEIFSNRIEFTNNGTPLIPPLRFLDEVPQSRNEALASTMRRLNICEERGSGIDKVVDSVETFQLPAPEFLATDSHTRAILYAHKNLKDMSKQEQIRACYQHACLKFVQNSQMTNTSLRGRLRISEKNYSMASRIISEAIDEGLVKRFDPTSQSKKHAKYVPFWAS